MFAAAAAFPAPSAPAPRGRQDMQAWGDWMAAGQRGEGGVYRRLLTEVSAWLRRYYARRLPLSLVEDAAQEALIAVHAKRHTYDPARPFGPWLAAIARYKWIDHLRALGRDKTDPIDDEVAVGDHGDAVTSAVVLGGLLSRLKPAQATVIRMVKLEGFSIEDAARATGQSPSLVKVNIHRGLAKLSGLVQRDEAA